MKIYLIGMPGAGKTTLGKQLADELLLRFVDLDKEIEKREGKSVTEIFSLQGEDHFRTAESKMLREWATSEKGFVMATGGGAPCFHDGINVINQSGLSVFLDVPLKELLRRIAAHTDRPLLSANDLQEKETKLISLRQNRLKYYQQAKITVTDPDLAGLIQAIHYQK